MSISEQEELLDDICNDVLGYGPLEPLLARDDIADIMVNGANTVYIEVAGKIQKTGIRFRDNQQLLNICQRIVSQIGRRVDESSPICDARLPDGSRVNVDRAAARDRRARAHHPQVQEGQAHPRPAGQVRLDLAGRRRDPARSSAAAASTRSISGGTGSGKTTLLNCLTRYIDDDERIITCEDAAELQLQQPHVVRLETRPPNLEGEGQVTMRDLVRNCLRMRPERIIVGEVRGPEAFDLLQAMNTGHDGSMGTLHANTPREALSRLESMITMGGFSLPSQDHPRDDLRLGRRDHPGRAPARRLAPHHPHHRGDGHGRRRHHHAGPVRLRDARRGRERQADRPAPLDRHRPAALLGARALLRRGAAARRRARCRRSRRRTARTDAEAAMPMQTLAMFFLVALAAGGVAWVFVYPLLSGERKAEQRQESVARSEPAARAAPRAATGPKVAPRAGRGDAQGARAARRRRPRTCRSSMRISQAGPDLVEAAVHHHQRGRRRCRCSSPASWSAAGLLVARSALGFAAGFGLPRWLLALPQEAPRERSSCNTFPDAVDVIVRGIKAGLPLLDCLRIITTEAPEPVRSEFRAIVETQTDRHPARRGLRQAATSACRCRRRISSAS